MYRVSSRLAFFFALIIPALLVLACSDDVTGPDDQEVVESADVVGQGIDGNLVAENGATLRRTDETISFEVEMPTPEPGSYEYPDPDNMEHGPPEAFTLWVFVFDEELGGFQDNPWSSAFYGAGHVVDGGNITLTGEITEDTEPFAGEDFQDPDAGIRFAVAPHGQVDVEPTTNEDLIPDEIKASPGCPDCWWFARFE